MSFVAINVLTVPAEAASTLEERFAGRAGSVESAPGFEHFELLRPVEGTDQYLVYTRWRTSKDYEAWTQSQAFARGHGGRAPSETPSGAGADAQRPAATGSSIWSFEVVQHADPRP